MITFSKITESDNYENYAGSANGEDQYTSGISIEHGNFGKRDSQADSSEGPPRKKVTSEI